MIGLFKDIRRVYGVVSVVGGVIIGVSFSLANLPLLVVFLSAFAGFIVIAVYIAMFDMYAAM